MLKSRPRRAAVGLSRCLISLLCIFSLGSQALAVRGSHLYPVPDEVSSRHFIVSVDGHSTPVMHATVWYYLLNFEVSKAATISVSASDANYWDAGVEIQPVRLGIRPRREGSTITFTIPGPVKLSISRPGDHFGDSEMLFLFANAPEKTHINASTRGVHYYDPGIHRENITARSGETIYLDPGAVVFGGLNVWQVQDVRVLGRGTIIYDGPQDPDHDEGWMHKPDWHVMVMDNARNVEIEGITGIDEHSLIARLSPVPQFRRDCVRGAIRSKCVCLLRLSKPLRF